MDTTRAARLRRGRRSYRVCDTTDTPGRGLWSSDGRPTGPSSSGGTRVPTLPLLSQSGVTTGRTVGDPDSSSSLHQCGVGTGPKPPPSLVREGETSVVGEGERGPESGTGRRPPRVPVPEVRVTVKGVEVLPVRGDPERDSEVEDFHSFAGPSTVVTRGATPSRSGERCVDPHPLSTAL